jgi:hypothetical protein
MTFRGFTHPEQNWSRLPHQLIDALPEFTTLSELAVVLYVLRHTWGYQEFGRVKRISLDEFQHGRKRKGGTRLDQGTGLRRSAIRTGLKRAVEHGFLILEKDESDLARVEHSYGLRIEESGGMKSIPLGDEKHPSGGRKASPVHRKVLQKETSERSAVPASQSLLPGMNPNGNRGDNPGLLEMVEALAEVLIMDIPLHKGKLFGWAHDLMPRYTAEQVLRAYTGPDCPWKEHISYWKVPRQPYYNELLNTIKRFTQKPAQREYVAVIE